MTASTPDFEALRIAAAKNISRGNPNSLLATSWDTLWLVDALAAERARADQAAAQHRAAEERITDALLLGTRLDSVKADVMRALQPYAIPTAEQPVDEWCREERCEYRHWASGSMPTHKRGHRCPAPTIIEGAES